MQPCTVVQSVDMRVPQIQEHFVESDSERTVTEIVDSSVPHLPKGYLEMIKASYPKLIRNAS